MDKKNKIDVFNRVYHLIVTQLGMQDKKLPLQGELIKDFGADSLEVVELIILLEREFSIEISIESAKTVKSIADAQKMVFLLLSKQAAHQ